MLTERQEKILNTVVEEYINSAEPVSSQALQKKHKFDLSPAMLRIEMQKLTKAGFLVQPHTSAGRVPTDKGYRFFVDNLPEEESAGFEDIFPIENIFKLTKFISETTSDLVFLRSLRENIFWKEGWEEILKEPEFENKDFVSNFTDFLEDFEEGVDNLELDSETCLPAGKVKIYIGKENPFSKIQDFSIISSGIFSILGPKRMDYNKNINLLKSATKWQKKNQKK